MPHPTRIPTSIAEAFATPVPPPPSRAHAQRSRQRIRDSLIERGVPPILAARTANRAGSHARAAEQMAKWTGRCALSGMRLQEGDPILDPIQRDDNSFVCNAIHSLQGALSDSTFIAICRAVARTHPEAPSAGTVNLPPTPAEPLPAPVRTITAVPPAPGSVLEWDEGTQQVVRR